MLTMTGHARTRTRTKPTKTRTRTRTRIDLEGQGLDSQGPVQGKGLKFGPYGVLKDKDKDFTYS